MIADSLKKMGYGWALWKKPIEKLTYGLSNSS